MARADFRAAVALWQASRSVRALLKDCRSCRARYQVLLTCKTDSRRPIGSTWLLPFAIVGLALAPDQADARAEAAVDSQLSRQTEGWHLLDLGTRRRAFFKYEKRVRDLSAPDKVFQYFATATTAEGIRMMRPADLLCSLVAVYPPDSSMAVRSGALPGERRPSSGHGDAAAQVSDFFRLFDVDGDGLISYFEYLLIVTFLSIPPQDVQIAFQMFDLDDSNAIDRKEFHEVTAGLRQRMRKVSHLQRTGFSAGHDEDQGLIESFFGSDGKKSLKLDQFADFLQSLHYELVKLEFAHYAGNLKGTMRGKDFARTLISGVDTGRADEYLDRVDILDEKLANMQVPLTEFENFAALRRDVHTLGVALEFYHNTVGHLKAEDFQRAARKITGQAMDKRLIHIVFAVFDTDQNGDLSHKELLEVLRRREGNSTYQTYGMERKESGATGLFKCLVNCVAGQSGPG